MKVNKLLDQLNEMGKKLSDARAFLKTGAIDELALTILKLYYFKDIRKDEINHWKKEVMSYVNKLKEFNINKSGLPKNYTFEELYGHIWTSNLLHEIDVNTRLSGFTTYPPDKLKRTYPLRKYKKGDEIIFSEFTESIIEYILEDGQALDWSILGV